MESKRDTDSAAGPSHPETPEAGSATDDVRYIWKNIVQSPSPICMFYFSHPLSTSTTTTTSATSLEDSGNASDFGKREAVVSQDLMRTMNNTNDVRRRLYSSSGNYNCNSTTGMESRRTGTTTTEREDLKEIVNETDRIRLASFVPWSRETWSRDEDTCSLVSPLVEIVAKRNGHQLPDVDNMLRYIRVAWNTPPVLKSPRFSSFTRFNSELALKNESQRHQNELNSPADASVQVAPTACRQDKQKQQKPTEEEQKPQLGQIQTAAAEEETMESGGKSTVRDPLHSTSSRPPHFNATKRRQHHRRRFSVPETIMRRHDLLRELGENFELAGAPYFLVKLYQTEDCGGATTAKPPPPPQPTLRKCCGSDCRRTPPPPPTRPWKTESFAIPPPWPPSITTTATTTTPLELPTPSTNIDSFFPCCCDSTTINSTPTTTTVIDFSPLTTKPPPPRIQTNKATATTTQPDGDAEREEAAKGVARPSNPPQATKTKTIKGTGCGFLTRPSPPCGQPPGSPQVITESVFCRTCCSRLFSAKRRLLATPMDYFYYERLPELSPYPRHHRQYRSMFLTSDDNSLLQPHSGDYGIPGGEQDQVETSETVQVASNQVCHGGGDTAFDNVVETSVITTATATTTTVSNATAVVASEHREARYFGPSGAGMCEQHVLCVNYSPNQQQPWTQRTAAESVVASSTLTSYPDDQKQHLPRSCPGCECELKIDQYISELLIENLNNNDHSRGNGMENEEREEEKPHNNEGDVGEGRRGCSRRRPPLNDIGYEENVNERQPRPNNNAMVVGGGGGCRGPCVAKEQGEQSGDGEGKNNSGNRDEEDVNCDNVVTTTTSAPVGDRMGVDNEGEEGATDRLTYFPCYTNDRNEIILGPVSSGSVYPDVDFENAILVPRLSAYPRSDSMEVRSSASGERIPPLDSEENLSLVDSLDGSSSLLTSRQQRREESLEREMMVEDQVRDKILQRTKSIENATTQNIEKPEAFFVPIGRTSYQEDLNIAKKMPAQIREKLNLRQRRRNFKREQELVRKNNHHSNHVQKTVIETTRLVNRVADMRIENSSTDSHPHPQRQTKKFYKSTSTPSSHTMFITKYHPAVIPLSPPTLPSNSRLRKAGIKGVKSDIGSLKSYTIDSKGNMQFQAPSTKGHVAKIATRKATVTTKLRKKCSSLEPHHGHGTGRSRKKSECMTLYQTMNLTPDSETGPRRIYQKTEIQDGEKRIEILEIVECAGSSSNSNHSMGRNSSRIPRPITKLPKHTSSATTVTSSSSGGDGVRAAMDENQISTDSDQSIADILIENLKNNTLCPDTVAVPQNRRPVTGPKFTQMFEVIPEEKSNASHDSTTDEKSSVGSGKAGGGGGADRRMNTNSNAAPKKMKAFTVLTEGSSEAGNPNGPEERKRSEEVTRGGGGWGAKENFKHPRNGNIVVKKGNRQPNGGGGGRNAGNGAREHLPKAKQLRETTSLTANTTNTPSTREADSYPLVTHSMEEVDEGKTREGVEQSSFIPISTTTTTATTEAQETQSNYNTTHSADSQMHYEFQYGTPTCTTSYNDEDEDEEDDGDREEDEENDGDGEDDCYTTTTTERDYTETVEGIAVVAEEVNEQHNSVKEAQDGLSIPDTPNGRVNSRRAPLGIRNELSICGTHFESIYGESICTHSVSIQTDAAAFLRDNSKATTGSKCEMDSSRLMLTDKEFKEFGTMTEEMERVGRQRQQQRGQPRYSSDEIEESSSAGVATTKSNKFEELSVQEVHEKQKDNKKRTREAGYKIPSSSSQIAGEEESGCVSVLSATTTDEFPDAGQCSESNIPTTTTTSMLSTSHQEVDIVRPSVTVPKPNAMANVTINDTTRRSNETEENAAAISHGQTTKSKNRQHQRIGEQKVKARGEDEVKGKERGQRLGEQEEEHVCKSRNIKYCQGKEIGYWDMSSQQKHQHHHHQNSTMDEKEGEGNGDDDQEMGKTRKPARNDDMNKDAGLCENDWRRLRHQKHDRPEQYCNTCSRSCQFCPTASEAMTGNVIGGATTTPPAAPVRTKTDQTNNNTGGKHVDNCTTSCCCSVCCSGFCSTSTPCCCMHGSSSWRSVRRQQQQQQSRPSTNNAPTTATGDEEVDRSDGSDMSPSENSTAITCSTTETTTSRRKHSRRCHREMTKSVGNNRVEHSSVCEQTTSELIKSVRPANMKRLQQKNSRQGKESEVESHEAEQQPKQQEKNRSRGDSIEEDNHPQTGCLGPINPERNKTFNNIPAQENQKKSTQTRLETDKDYERNVSGNETVNIEPNRLGNQRSGETVIPAAHWESTKTNNKTNSCQQQKDDSREEDNSTPETVINKSVRGDQNELTSRSEEEDDDEDAAQDVVEWARRKKRKVQTQLNREEEKQRTVIRHQQSINRTDDIMKVNNRAGVNASSTSNTNGSWSVTVAGCYHPNMAPPDLQMRLSFPGTRNANADAASSATMNWNEPAAVTKLPRHPSLAYEEVMVPELDINHDNDDEDGERDNEDGENDDEDERPEDATMRQVLPVIDVVPRKSLMRAPLDDYNSVRAGTMSSSVTNDRLMTNKTKSITRRTSRKSIKQIDCNVAVESATTRTISRITKGQRAISYHHAIGGNGGIGIGDQRKKKNYDYGPFPGITSGRTSVRNPSHQVGGGGPGSYYLQQQQQHRQQKGGASSTKGPHLPPPLLLLRPGSPTAESCRLWLDSNQSTRRTEDLPCLSVNGNAIAPEIKPRVPTMSEKDLTRRHSSCFTRNSRPFYA